MSGRDPVLDITRRSPINLRASGKEIQTMAVLDDIAAERQRLTERLARVDAERQKLTEQSSQQLASSA